MGRRGHVQTRHCNYGVVEFSDWGQEAAYNYLTDVEDLNVVAPGNDMTIAESADRWEIEVPYDENNHFDWKRLEGIVDKLKENPDLIKAPGWTKDCPHTPVGDDFAALLEEGIVSAKKHNYSWIIIDWW